MLQLVVQLVVAALLPVVGYLSNEVVTNSHELVRLDERQRGAEKQQAIRDENLRRELAEIKEQIRDLAQQVKKLSGR